MPARILTGAMCVQRVDDSLNSAIHITYRISLRSSSMPEPRDPLLKVLFLFIISTQTAGFEHDLKSLRRALSSHEWPATGVPSVRRSNKFTVNKGWEQGPEGPGTR